MVGFYKGAIQTLRRPDANGKVGPAKKVAEASIKVLVPIVKVPTNFASEVVDHTPVGAAKALGTIIWNKGRENMSREQNDYVMRLIKKSTIGLAALIIGYYNSDDIGGYYQMGEKRKADDVKWGSIKVFGVNVPTLLLHTPLLEMLQIGATIARVKKHYMEMAEKHPGKERGNGFVAGAYAGGVGIASEVPFLEQPARLAQAWRTAESARIWTDQMIESLVTPPDLRRVAKMTDTAGSPWSGPQIPREQKSLGQMFRGDIPGQRSKLPLDMNRVQKMPLDQLAVIMENAPPDVVDQIKPVAESKYIHDKTSTIEELERYHDLIWGKHRDY